MIITLFSIKINIIMIGFALLSLVVSLILSKVFKKLISPFLLRRFAKTRFHYDEIEVRAFTSPTSAMIIFLGVYFFAFFFLDSFVAELPFDESILQHKVLRISVIIYVTWGVFGLSDIFGEMLRVVGSKIDIETGKSVSKFLGNIYRFVVIALGIMIIISEFGYDVNGFLAGLGLGGLTFALAAQDSASNFFSGLVLIFEKPFDVGDWVKLDGAEGEVEAITFRSTYIRDVSGTKIVIPNSKITVQPITSFNSIPMRYASQKINFQPENRLEDLELFVSELESLLKGDEGIMHNTVITKISDFTVYGIVIKLAYGTKTTDYMEFLEKKQQINVEVLRLVTKYNLKMSALSARE